MERRPIGRVVLALAAACAAPIAGAGDTPPPVDPPPTPPSGSEVRRAPTPPDAAAVLPQHETPPPARPVGAEAAREVPFDLATLEARLRDTAAIGILTKIALRNQIGDLLDEFRARHLDDRSDAIVALREPYDLLVLKVLALIQDGDPTLARSIAASREAIWSILADRGTFDPAI